MSERETDQGGDHDRADQDSADHLKAYATSREDRDRTLSAVRSLEASLARAAGREGWHGRVMSALADLETEMTAEREELRRPDSLLAMIAGEHPRLFGSRVRSFIEQYDDIGRQAASLRGQIEAAHREDLDPLDIRQRAGWIVNALTHCRARQTDLVFEALTLDLGAR